jgi:hypothetical protein
MNQTDKENLHKEIDLIQECIKRMASNSFLLKGWTISLVAVVLALSEKNVSPYFLGLVVLVPLISFWYLDAFFLYTEKLYRKMYEWVINERPKSNNERMYDLNPHRFKDQLRVKKWNKEKKVMEETNRLESEWTVMWSKTLRCFYFIPIVLIMIILIVLFVKGTTCTTKTGKKMGISKELVNKVEEPAITNTSPKKLEAKEKNLLVNSEIRNANNAAQTQHQTLNAEQKITSSQKADRK